MKVVVVRERFLHMGNHSGYDLLFEALSNNKLLTLYTSWYSEHVHYAGDENLLKTLGLPFSSKTWKYYLKRLVKGSAYAQDFTRHQANLAFQALEIKSPFYTLQSFYAELNAIYQSVQSQADLIHIAYVEDCLGLLSEKRYKEKLTAKLIGTLHQPYSWWMLYGDLSTLETLDTLIVLSESEKRKFEIHFPGRVIYIPHGVDFDYFIPQENLQFKERQFRCVFSGQWLRDVAILIDVIYRMKLKYSDIVFDIIYPKKKPGQEFLKISGLSGVYFHHNVSSEKLRSLYQNASLAFIPLIDCTANNAILECMAVGLPIITSDVEGVKSYTNETFTTYCIDFEQFCEAIQKVYENRLEYYAKGREARSYVREICGYELITKQTIEAYNKTLF